MSFEYLFISYIIQKNGGYLFYEKSKDVGVTVDSVNNILPVLNHYGKKGWEFICWDSGRLLFKRSY